MTGVLSFEGGWKTTRDAEQAFPDAAADAGRRIRLACTHFAPADEVVVSTQAEPLEPLEGGRAFLFPGSEALTGRMQVAELLAATAIERVVALGGRELGADDVLDTQGFVRPTFVGGSLVLQARPGIGGVFVPFEQPNPTPCCADHD
jgi:hypothetical protein